MDDLQSLYHFQVVAVVDETHPLDEAPPEREDGLSHILGSYIDEKLAFYGLGSEQVSLMHFQTKRNKLFVFNLSYIIFFH